MLPAALHPDSLWRPLEQLVLPPRIREWMADPASLTLRLTTPRWWPPAAFCP